jgi:hypothetical protein
MLTFDPIKHEYRDGTRVVPSVTQILAPLSNFDFVDPGVLRAAQNFGSAVHLACELWDLGTLNRDALDPALEPYLQGWVTFCREHACDWTGTGAGIELRVHNQAMGYAGTLDRVGQVDSELAMVDIKSGSRLFPSTGPQTAAYAHAHMPAIARSIKRYAVRLFPGGYELKHYADPLDWPTFCSLLTLGDFCNRHRITLNFKETSL